MSSPLVQEKTYLITRHKDGGVEARVVAPFRSDKLVLRWDLLRCGDRFDVGCRTNAAKQLAIAILADVFGSEDAVLLHEGFTNEIIDRLHVPPGTSTKITYRDVVSWKHNPVRSGS